MITINKLAKRWQCSREHIEQLIRRGMLQAFKLDPDAKRASWRIHKDSVTAFENRQQAVARG